MRKVSLFLVFALVLALAALTSAYAMQPPPPPCLPGVEGCAPVQPSIKFNATRCYAVPACDGDIWVEAAADFVVPVGTHGYVNMDIADQNACGAPNAAMTAFILNGVAGSLKAKKVQLDVGQGPVNGTVSFVWIIPGGSKWATALTNGCDAPIYVYQTLTDGNNKEIASSSGEIIYAGN